MDIASNIKAIRRAKGITPTMMAKELGIEASNYPKFENRGNQLTYSNLEKISDALGVTVVELITWENRQELTSTGGASKQDLQDKIKELTTARDIAQGYAEELKRKNDGVYYIFHSAIKTIGEEAKLGTVHLVEDNEDYVLYSTTFTDKELILIFKIMYNTYAPLYYTFRDLLQRAIIDSSVREASLFLKFNNQKIKDINKNNE